MAFVPDPVPEYLQGRPGARTVQNGLRQAPLLEIDQAQLDRVVQAVRYLAGIAVLETFLDESAKVLFALLLRGIKFATQSSDRTGRHRWPRGRAGLAVPGDTTAIRSRETP